jgi:hypothetical protein
MRRSTSVLYFVCAALLACAGCAPRAEYTPAAAEVTAAPQAAPTPDPTDPTDPACCGIVRGRGDSEGVELAWREFTKDGRYRLARDEDMRFPEAALARMGPDRRAHTRPFVYAWGRRNFDTEQDHLAAIVVDTSRTGPDNFGLVMFSSPKGGKGYRPYWVFEGRDLSRTVLSAPSGYLMVSELSEDGARGNGCDIFWNERKRRFVCTPMKD